MVEVKVCVTQYTYAICSLFFKVEVGSPVQAMHVYTMKTIMTRSELEAGVPPAGIHSGLRLTWDKSR